MATEKTLQFYPQQSKVEPSAWSALGQTKLNDLKLSIGPLHFEASCACAAFHGDVGVAAPVTITPGSLSPKDHEGGPPSLLPVATVGCTAWLLNTVDDLRTCAKADWLKAQGQQIWDAITSRSAFEQPHLLTTCLLLLNADLKKYNFAHCVAFPALKTPSPFRLLSSVSLAEALPALLCDRVCCALTEPGASLPCLLTFTHDSVSAQPLSALLGGAGGSAAWPEGAAVAVVDSSPVAGVLGWTARNLLVLLAATFPGATVRLVSMKAANGKLHSNWSQMLTVRLPDVGAGWAAAGAACPEVVGWEAGTSGPPGELRVAKLGESLDPQVQAADAVHLNLKLMKWRAAPALDIKAVSDLKCLLLGVGTLGCEVARTLLAWGVTDLHLVDNGRVAFSNPVRQSLFQFADCVSAPGGAPKAEAAASAIKRIFPGVKATASCFSIAMPGHPPAPEEVETTQQEVERLDELVAACDVVFLLTDTRESRWLPTMLAAAHNKVLINAALGFDGWVVMRHGHGPHASGPSGRLGCYFCNDVVAPLNSMVGRSLDEQCTVARPGLARIAGAMAVELLAAMMQHPEPISAPPDAAPVAALGSVPHMLRGALNGFSQTHMTGSAQEMCTACSAAVVDAYRSSGWEFVHRALREPAFLEQLTGLDKLMASMSKQVEQEERTTASADEDNDEWLEL